jgi:hypothetical protein
METKAYLYRWTHIPSQKWYVGSRTGKGCHPDDGYICSSKIVKPMITENKNASFTGYCVSPNGIKYDSCIKDAKDFDVSRQSIMRWSKNNLKGWSFIPKDIKL